MEKYDVIIIGAGAAGLMAANILSHSNKKICILEARDRIGGRIHTIGHGQFSKAIEAGAEFIHGNLPLTKELLNKAGIRFYETSGNLWEFKNNKLKKRQDFIEHAEQLINKLEDLDHDISIAELLATYFIDAKYAEMKKSLQQYVEGYSAADINLASSMALKEEWQSTDEEQYRIEGGYTPLMEYLKMDCLGKGCIIHLNTVAKKIKWQDDDAEIIVNDNLSFFSNKVVVTLPPIFLTGETLLGSISFEPKLSLVTAASKEIGYGGVIKVILEFTHAFWESSEYRNADNMFFLFSDEKIPTWWSQLPDYTPILTGWLAGPNANEFAHTEDKLILEEALNSLASIFAVDKDMLQQYLIASQIYNWLAEPFTRGAYSYNTVTSAAAKKILSTPVAKTLFFAGEAVDKGSNATVEAALSSGKYAADQILKS